MKKFLACLIAVIFLFESISVGVPMLAGKLSVSAEEEDETILDADDEDDFAGEDDLDDEDIEDDLDDEDEDESDEISDNEDGSSDEEFGDTEEGLEENDPEDIDFADEEILDSEDIDEESDLDDDEEDTDDMDDAEMDAEDTSVPAMPASAFSDRTTGGVFVEASYGENVFPANTTMQVTDIPKEEVLSAVNEVLDNVVDLVAVDISFLSESGEELEPADSQSVSVTISLDAPLEEGDQSVIHIDDSGNAETIAQNDITNISATTAEFVADAFSTYVVATSTDGKTASADPDSGTQSVPNSITEGKFAFILDDSTKTATLYAVPGTAAVAVPSTVTYNNTTYTVTKVGDGSGPIKIASGGTSPVSIPLPDTVTEISASALSGLTSLTNIVLSKKLTTIGASAFSGDTGLTSILIPSTVTSIGSNAFSGMSSGFTMYVYSGSTAETYAKNNSITYASIGTSSNASTTASTTSTTSTTTKDSDDDDEDSSSFATGDTKTTGSGSKKAEFEKTGSNTVTYTEAKISSSAKTATIPGTVKISSKTYKVTEVAEDAFSGYKSLQKVIVGQYVEDLDEKMISNCPKLTTLSVNTKKLKSDNVSNSLKGSNVETIIVPSTMVKTYTKVFTKANTGSKKKLVVQSPTSKKTTTTTKSTTGTSTKNTTSKSSTGTATKSTTGTSTKSTTSKSSTGTSTKSTTGTSTKSTASKSSTGTATKSTTGTSTKSTTGKSTTSGSTSTTKKKSTTSSAGTTSKSSSK